MSRTADVAVLAAEVDEAVQVFRDGQPAHAVRALKAVRRRAQRLGTDDPTVTAVVARTYMSQSAAEFDLTGDREAALRLLASADELAARVGDERLGATVDAQRALVVLRSGDTQAALRAFDEAASRMELLSPQDRIIILLNRGALLLELAALDRAESDLTRCIALCEEVGEARLGSMARHNLGCVDFLAGRLPRALSLMQEAAEPHPVALLDHARVLREAGLVRDADAVLEQAAAAFQQGQLQQDLAETELVRAECALVDGDLDRGRRLAAAAHRRFARRHNVRWQRKAELLLLRFERLAADDRRPRFRRTVLAAVADRAEELADGCRREERRDLARGAELLAQECRILAGDEPSEASSTLAPRTLPRPRPADPLQVRLQIREVRALAALHAGDRTRAAGEVHRGLSELGAYQHSFGSLDLRTASAVHGDALARLGLEIAVGSASPARVLNLIEHARAVSTRLPSVRPPGDPETAGLLNELRQVEDESRALEGEAGAEEVLGALRERSARLQRRIRARSWQVEGEQGEAADAPRCATVREAAKQSGTAFVTLARHQGRWVGVCLRGSRCALHDLAPVATVTGLVNRVRADLDALAMPHLPPPMQDAVRRSLDLGLARLDELLLAPLRIGDRPVVVSCSGDLVFLPWGLLPGRKGLSTVVTPSAATWLSTGSRTRTVRPRVAAVAGPDLRCAESEAQVVGRIWPSATALTGTAASVAGLHRALVTADLVHVAAHGRHRPDNPLFSSVRMADGDVYAYELDAAAGLAGCVVLSACEAGLATLRPGDESLGLAHVLLQLGTGSVIAGVARVSDDVSAELMERLHRSMARGTDAATALAEAQQATEDAAGFVCFGATW